MLVDLRSDTFTKPTPGMLEAMSKAPVGDDVFEEDPSVNQLEQVVASLFGREAALYCPNGTMSNQIAIKAHTNPGDEVICERNSHVYQYEGGGIAFNAGCQVNLVDGNRGRITADQVRSAINPDDVHKASSKLVCLENTCNRGGGSCYDINDIAAIRKLCNAESLSLHLDGARLFNAMVAKGENALEYGRLFHSISICLNKGLGCPIGSVLVGDRSFIRKARRIRKVFGGGMRQAGYMAATGIYALENHIDRLAIDHLHAKKIGEELSKKDFCTHLFEVETNIVIFQTPGEEITSKIIQTLKEKDVLAISMGPTLVRFVFHLDVSEEMVDYTISTLKSL